VDRLRIKEFFVDFTNEVARHETIMRCVDRFIGHTVRYDCQLRSPAYARAITEAIGVSTAVVFFLH
jgi:hypothetical protein